MRPGEQQAAAASWEFRACHLSQSRAGLACKSLALTLVSESSTTGYYREQEISLKSEVSERGSKSKRILAKAASGTGDGALEYGNFV